MSIALAQAIADASALSLSAILVTPLPSTDHHSSNVGTAAVQFEVQVTVPLSESAQRIHEALLEASAQPSSRAFRRTSGSSSSSSPLAAAINANSNTTLGSPNVSVSEYQASTVTEPISPGIRVYACVQAGNCLGGGAGCTEGSTGALCGVCEAGWAMSNDGCRRCEGDRGVTIASVIVMSAVVAIVMVAVMVAVMVWAWSTPAQLVADATAAQASIRTTALGELEDGEEGAGVDQAPQQLQWHDEPERLRGAGDEHKIGETCEETDETEAEDANAQKRDPEDVGVAQDTGGMGDGEVIELEDIHAAQQSLMETMYGKVNINFDKSPEAKQQEVNELVSRFTGGLLPGLRKCCSCNDEWRTALGLGLVG